MCISRAPLGVHRAQQVTPSAPVLERRVACVVQGAKVRSSASCLSLWFLHPAKVCNVLALCLMNRAEERQIAHQHKLKGVTSRSTLHGSARGRVCVLSAQAQSCETKQLQKEALSQAFVSSIRSY